MAHVSEEKLKALLEKAGKVTATSMRVTPTMIALMVFELLQAREEIVRSRNELRLVNMEADWLASQHWPVCPNRQVQMSCNIESCNETCHAQCWRVAAKKAVQNVEVKPDAHCKT